MSVPSQRNGRDLRPTAGEVLLANQALLDAANRLVEQLDEFPAGRVLRCFSRAVRLVRRSGCPVDRLVADAEVMTLALLMSGPTRRRDLVSDLKVGAG